MATLIECWVFGLFCGALLLFWLAPGMDADGYLYFEDDHKP